VAKTREVVIPMDQEEESGGGRFRVPDGDYRVKITGAKYTTSSQKATPGLEVHYVIAEGKKKGAKFEDTCWLSPKALWRVRALLEAVGVDVPKKRFKLDVTKLKGKELGVTFTEEEDTYEKNGVTKKVIRSNVSDFLDLDSLTTGGVDDEDEDEGLDDDEELDDEEEEDEDPLADLDRSDLKKYIKKNKLDVKVKQSDDEDDIRAKIKEAEGDEDEDDDELEELDVDDDL
jgi:hypothetical protein